MPKRPNACVSVTIMADGSVAISGGCISSCMKWFPGEEPTTFDVAGEKFITLRATDIEFATLCGAPLANNSFLVELCSRRQHACEVAINRVVNELFDLRRASRTRQKAARMKLFQEQSDQLFATVDLSYPDAPDGKITVKFEQDNRKSIAVPLLADTLQYIVDQVREGAGASLNRKKTPKNDRCVFQHPEIKMNTSRNAPCVRYRDSDGIARYHSAKLRKHDPCDDEDRNSAYREAADELHEYLMANNFWVGGKRSDESEDVSQSVLTSSSDAS